MLRGSPEEPQGATHGSVRVSRALGQLSAAFSGLLTLFISKHTAHATFGSQHPSATTPVFQPCTSPWICSNFMPGEAQALHCQLMDLKMPGDPGTASLASLGVELCCRGGMVGVWVPKSHGGGDAHPTGSQGRTQALPGGESCTHFQADSSAGATGCPFSGYPIPCSPNIGWSPCPRDLPHGHIFPRQGVSSPPGLSTRGFLHPTEEEMMLQEI